jgi:oligopeptide/dipeptide ABC transporter ATP-binding protein
VVRAVDGVSFTLAAGETLGLVGESGCGKSMTALSVLGAVPEPGRVAGGEVLFEGQDLRRLSEGAMQRVRGRRIAMIPQDPLSALNPAMKVGAHLTEVLSVHLGMRGGAARQRAIELLDHVGIPAAGERFDAYPHQLSGGMRQRVLIALAIACRPALLIADEPTTALDATIQAQILDLLAELTRAAHMALLLITHNLGIVAGYCDRVAVMYAGRLVETAPVDALFTAPRHRYTVGLLECVPRLDRPGKGVFHTIRGAPPDLSAVPPGCPFHPRCAHVVAECSTVRPELMPVNGATAAGGETGAAEVTGKAGHLAACWNPQRDDEERARELREPRAAVAAGVTVAGAAELASP